MPAKNIDTGAGLERLTCVLQEKNSDYETDVFSFLIEQISRLSSISYQENPGAFRVIADHSRSVCFLIAEGILPSREDRGYILRRILRRAIRYCQKFVTHRRLYNGVEARGRGVSNPGGQLSLLSRGAVASRSMHHRSNFALEHTFRTGGKSQVYIGWRFILYIHCAKA